MNYPTIASVLTVLTLTVAGCGEQGQQADTAEEGAADSAAPTSAPASEGSAMDQVRQQAQAAMNSATQAGQQALQAATGALDVAQQEGGSLTELAKTQVRELVDQAKTFLDENQIGSAQDILDRLNELDLSLPDSVQDQIDQLQTRIAEMQTEGNAGEAQQPAEGGEAAN
ncbi:MAG: hypothetical protein GVY22_02535 [Gammaproteobacteria bacterium]|jgi:gas vesicle protein|nr:hypothetical protein [Gammaproteobacteria bacterium]